MLRRGEGRQAVATSIVGGPDAIIAVEAEWRRLLGAATRDEPFLHPAWIRIHLESFEPDAHVRLVCVRRAGRLVGILPLVEEEARWKGFPYRRLRSASGVHSCRFDLLAEEGEEEAAAEAIFEHLRALPGWDVIEIHDVPAGGSAERLLSRADAAGFHVGTWESMRTPYVVLPASGGVEALHGRLSSKFRANLRRRRKRLAEGGAISFRRTERADPAWLERFYRLEASGWKGRRGTAIAADPRTRAFYDRIAAHAEAEGMLAFYSLERDGEPVAMHFGLVHGGRYFLPKPAYDEAFASCSPGQLLMEDVLTDCIDRGLEVFDFLGPCMDWKLDWTDRVLPHRWCFIHRPNARGRALYLARRRLGPWLARLRERRGGGGRGSIGRTDRRGA